MLGSELWEKDFSYLLAAVKEFIVNVWEARKLKLYGDDTQPGLHAGSSGWDLGQDGKLRSDMGGKLNHTSVLDGSYACTCMSNVVNVCGSAHCGCVVNGSSAMAAY